MRRPSAAATVFVPSSGAAYLGKRTGRPREYADASSFEATPTAY
ncbi:hypothetical protein ACWFQ8_06940 [Streptomyces sp. NPDC055254]